VPASSRGNENRNPIKGQKKCGGSGDDDGNGWQNGNNNIIHYLAWLASTQLIFLAGIQSSNCFYGPAGWLKSKTTE
jgi:hypothetical protein